MGHLGAAGKQEILKALKSGRTRKLAWLLAALAFAAWLTRACSTFGSDRFDREKWLQQVTAAQLAGVHCYRGGMAKDIVKHVLSVGMHRTAVEAQLGMPDNVNGSDLQYTLGMCSGFDYDVLHIYFDAQDRVTHAAIIQH